MVAAARGSIARAPWTYTMHAPQHGERITNDNQAIFGKIVSIRHKTLDFGNPSM
jgi:hypothetical protein